MVKKTLLLLFISITVNASIYDGNNAENKGNYIKAAKYYKIACNRGNAKACNKLGVLYNSGMGVSMNFLLAAKLYKKACKKRYPFACTNLGYMYEFGQGLTKNRIKALRLYKKGCELKSVGACVDYKILHHILYK